MSDSQSGPAAAIFSRMPPTSKKKKSTKLRAWRVSLLRQRAHYLGTVEAPDERATEAAAVAHSMKSSGSG